MSLADLAQTLISILETREKKRNYPACYDSKNFSDYYYQQPRPEYEPMCLPSIYWSAKRTQRLRRKKILDEKRRLRKEAKMVVKNEVKQEDEEEIIVID